MEFTCGKDCNNDVEDAHSVEESFTTANERREKASKICVYDYQNMIDLFEKNEIDVKHLHKIWRHFIQLNMKNVRSIKSLPEKVYSLIEEQCSTSTVEVLEQVTSQDTSTVKLVIKLQDGLLIETVIMRYGKVDLDTFPENKNNKNEKSNESKNRLFSSTPRTTVCVSSQVGCDMGCHFCSTGQMGLLANITCAEIIEQLVVVKRIEPFRNVVFMGMGEPLANYEEVVNAIKLMTHTQGFQLALSHITVSTVGIVPRIHQLKTDLPEINLAVSLHAPNQKLREQIVPTAVNWNIQSIIDASVDFILNSKRSANKKRRVLFEYVLIRDVNCSLETANELRELLLPYKDIVSVNVIPYNPSELQTKYNFETPSMEETDAFISTLRRDIVTTIRQTLGKDIASACGQLTTKTLMSNKLEYKPLEDLEQSLSVDTSTEASPANEDRDDLVCTVPTQKPKQNFQRSTKKIYIKSDTSNTSTGKTCSTYIPPIELYKLNQFKQTDREFADSYREQLNNHNARIETHARMPLPERQHYEKTTLHNLSARLLKTNDILMTSPRGPIAKYPFLLFVEKTYDKIKRQLEEPFTQYVVFTTLGCCAAYLVSRKRSSKS